MKGVFGCLPVPNDSFHNVSSGQRAVAVDHFELVLLLWLLLCGAVNEHAAVEPVKAIVFELTAYGSDPSVSGMTSVFPWTTTSILKWSMSSLVTAYGAPMTTSSTY